MSFKICIDASQWQRGFNDGRAGKEMERVCLSYASGFIEGRAQYHLNITPERQRLFRGASNANPASTSVDSRPRATARTPLTRQREAKEERQGRERRHK